MIQMSIAALAICVLAAMSIRANRRFREADRLPMQWSLDGSVNWTAPRAFALSFTPLLAVVILTTTTALTTFLKPRPGQEGLVVPTMVFIALVFIGAHGLHLWLIGKSLRRDG
jgi:hypothetical protein